MFCGAVILAGGRSERMHFPKLYLNFDGRSFAEKIVDEYRMAGIKPVVVINHEFAGLHWKRYVSRLAHKAILVPNEEPARGRLHSLKLGLRALPKPGYCFVQNVDNPFVDHSIIGRLCRARNVHGYVLPVHKSKGGHPVLANRNILDAVLGNTNEALTLRDVLGRFGRKELHVNDDSVLVNMNSPIGYYREMLKYRVLQYIS